MPARTYRLRHEVQAQGHPGVSRTLKAHGLRAQQPRSFVPHAPDLAPTTPNRVWVGDLTYLPRQGDGWLYLSV